MKNANKKGKFTLYIFIIHYFGHFLVYVEIVPKKM